MHTSHMYTSHMHTSHITHAHITHAHIIHIDSMSSIPPDSHGVPIAMASGQLSVHVRLRQSECPGPKLEVECQLGSLHLLLSPNQLTLLLEMASGLASQGNPN